MIVSSKFVIGEELDVVELAVFIAGSTPLRDSGDGATCDIATCDIAKCSPAIQVDFPGRRRLLFGF